MGDTIPNLLTGNIKQKLVPFVLNPDKANNVATVNGNTELNNAYPQVFTYKGTKYNEGFPQALLSFMPKSFKDVVKKDISYKLLYNDSNITEDTPNAGKLTYKTIFDNIPGVLIREFLPDTKLDQLITAIGSLLDIIGNTFKDKTLTLVGAEFVKSLESVTSQVAAMDINAFKKFGSYLVDYLLNTNVSKDLSAAGLSSTFANDLFTNGMTDKFKDAYTGNTGSCLLNAMALKIPYMLYYGLQSTTTTNIYEVPFVNEPKLLYTSSGSAGWGDSAGFISHILDSAKSILGSIIPNIGISMTPWWNSSSGQGTFEDEVVVNFDLYNDGKEQAMKNFIFVNTIIPNNKWLLYGLIQHSPCLYDVKVEGIKRMYACTGDFKVTYSGVLRKMPKKFILELVSQYINRSFADGLQEEKVPEPDPYDSKYNEDYDHTQYAKDDEKVFKQNQEIESANNQRKKDRKNLVQELLPMFEDNIRIPDVYHVSLTFKSLLPSNLNLYLFLYIGNTHIINEYANGGVRTEGATNNILSGVVNVRNSLDKILTSIKTEQVSNDMLKEHNASRTANIA